MIYDVPTCDPWIIISGQTDYMVWAVSGEENVYDIIDNNCKKIANLYFNKIFIRIVISSNRSFAKIHKLKRTGDICRVKNGKPYWWISSPCTKFVWFHMKECGEKIISTSLNSSIQLRKKKKSKKARKKVRINSIFQPTDISSISNDLSLLTLQEKSKCEPYLSSQLYSYSSIISEIDSNDKSHFNSRIILRPKFIPFLSLECISPLSYNSNSQMNNMRDSYNCKKQVYMKKKF